MANAHATPDTIVERLDRLERENRRLKWAGAVVLAGIAVAVMMGQAASSNVAKVVEAETFILRDQDGRRRGELAITRESGASLSLFYPDGRAGARVYAKPDGSSALDLGRGDGRRTAYLGGGGDITLFQLYGRDAMALLSLAPEPFGNRLSILLKDKLRLTLGEESVGAIGLGLSDGDGKGRAKLTVGADGSSALGFYDENGQARAFLDYLHGMPRLRLLDKGGETRLGLILEKQGHAAVTLQGADGKSRAMMMMLPDGRTDLSFIDKNDRVIWRAP